MIKEHADGNVEVELFRDGKSLTWELVSRDEARIEKGLDTKLYVYSPLPSVNEQSKPFVFLYINSNYHHLLLHHQIIKSSSYYH